jgi:long-chain acyl-CoA synthetase
MNIVEKIRQETAPFLDKTAIVEGADSVSYRQLLERVAALRDLMAERGIRPGQRIALRCTDGIDYVIGALALLDCGAAVTPVADSLTGGEVRETVERIDVAGILTHTKMPRLADDQKPEKLDEIFLWQALPSNSEMDQRCVELGAAFIRFSSGTTGESKGVVLSHRSIVERTDAANRGLEISDRDVVLWVLGMSHHFVVSILLFLRKGACIVVANRNFPFSLLEAAGRADLTVIYASPVHFYLLAASDSVSPQSLRKVRLAISTSMKMSADIFSKFSGKFGISPAEAYGIIEIGLPFINTDGNASGQNTVGRMLPYYQLRIAKPDEHGVGEVQIKGKGMFDAYFSPWRWRDECLIEGWFETGDLGKVDEQGRLCLLGRSKTVIVCAGMKVFPEEVEEAINSFAGVAESLVWGREHPQFGQVPVANVVVQRGRDVTEITGGLRKHCCDRLSSYKVPVEFIAVEKLVKTVSGKLSRAHFQ